MTIPLVKSGRIARGVVALAALAAAALGALLFLTWSCCSSPGLDERLGNPAFWASVSSILVALAAFPPVSSRLRGTKLRWVLLPLALAALALCAWLATLTAEGLRNGGASAKEALTTFLPVAVLIAFCAVYVLVRVVFARKPHSPSA
jgi:hypothetical protein